MIKKFYLQIDEPVITESTGNHIATSWEIRSSSEINDNNILYQSLNDSNSILEKEITLDINNDDLVYLRVQLHFEKGISKWSDIVSVHANQEGYKLSNSIVATPTVTYKINTETENARTITLECSDLKMFIGYGNWKSTTWVVKTTDNVVAFIRVKDEEYKKKITFNLDMLDLSKPYIIEAKQYTDNNAESLYGRTTLVMSSETGLMAHNSFDIEITTLAAYQKVEANVIIKAAGFKSVDIKVVNETTGESYESLNQESLTPVSESTIDQYGIGVDDVASIYANIKAEDGSETGWKLIYQGKPKYPGLVDINYSINYPGKFTQEQDLLLGGYTVQSVRQTVRGDIYLVKHHTKDIYRYRYDNGVLEEKEVVGRLCQGSDQYDVNIQYFTVNDFYNDPNTLFVTYVLSNKNHYRQLMMEKYDLTDGGFKLIKQRREGWTYGWAMTSRHVVLANNHVHWCHTSADDNRVNFSNPNLDASNRWWLPNDYQNLQIRRNISLCMLEDPDELLLFGGSTANPISTDGGNRYDVVWPGFYKISNKNQNWIKLADFNDLLNQLDDRGKWYIQNIFAWQAVLRRDGKVAMFNACDCNFEENGLKIKDQVTFVFDPVTSKIVMEDTDFKDNHPYRNIITLRDGSVLRISSKEFDPQYVHRYIANNIPATGLVDRSTDGTEDILIINEDTNISIETPYKYKMIIVKDGGTINWYEYVNSNNQTINSLTTYTGPLLLISQSHELTNEEFETITTENGVNNVRILNNVNFKIK